MPFFPYLIVLMNTIWANIAFQANNAIFLSNVIRINMFQWIKNGNFNLSYLKEMQLRIVSLTFLLKEKKTTSRVDPGFLIGQVNRPIKWGVKLIFVNFWKPGGAEVVSTLDLQFSFSL